MVLFDPNDPVKAQLESLREPLATSAQSCIETMFGIRCSVDGDWTIVERLRGEFPHNICLGCGSNEYQALVVLGTVDEVIKEFIGSVERNEILDAFGEMLNVYFALLMDNLTITELFGILTQSIPQYSAEVNYFPRAWGCNGTLLTPLGGSMYLGFAIKKNRTFQL